MTYQETIDYLFAQLPMFSRIGAAAYKADLDNTIALCKALDNPEQKFISVHVAGTNGKGSTSHMLAAILQTAGYKTGLYTSPHLKDFRERIRINGEMISQQFVIDFTERTKALSATIEPSFFELTVAMAFDYFVKEKVDIAIIETGLGGRLDSTNVINPILSVITNIGYDHMNLLGNTLEAIAGEKAGIIKPNTPVVIGEFLPETEPVFRKKSTNCKAPMHYAPDEFLTDNIQTSNHYLTLTVTNTRKESTADFTLDLNGLYQAKNLRTVLSAVEIIREKGFEITDEVIQFATAHTKQLTGLHGRWDVISENPTVVLDVAHNEDGIRQLLDQLETVDAKSKWHIVIGMVKDKEVTKVLSLLPRTAQYYFTNAHIPRAMPVLDLQASALTFGLKGNCFDDVNAAIASAKLVAEKEDIIIVCGSVFLVGEVDHPSLLPAG